MDKKYYTIRDIAKCIEMLYAINVCEMINKRKYKDDEEALFFIEDEAREARDQLTWIFKLDIDTLIKAKKCFEGDETVDGDEIIDDKYIY